MSQKDGDDPDFRVELLFDKTSLLYERSVSGLLENLAEVGGLAKGMTVICRAIA